MSDRRFDPTEPLPEGITMLEASAGTGKTHTVASIVVREVADGRPLDQLLVVTFTRKATGALRERVWQRLAEAARALHDDAPAPADPLLEHLRAGSSVEVAERRRRLERAVSDFDAATIATTHGFCQQVLAGLGVAGDAERDLEVVESVRDLIEDAVTDMFIRRFHAGEHEVLFSHRDALAIAQAVVANPDAEIAKGDDNDGDRLRWKFARGLRTRIEEQKRKGRLITYDDLLTRLRTSIEQEVTGEVAVERLRTRFTTAIVDEFQDTDSVQWKILDAAFGAPPSRLVLVGDPKQAVYAFRGGDIYSYEQAARSASTKLTLDVSWRSDQPLLDGVDALFAGAELGGESIRHRPLRARPGAERRRLLGEHAGAPVTVRIVDRSLIEHQGRYPYKQDIRPFVGEDLAAEAARILNAGSTIVERDLEGTDVGVARPVTPRDLAVLVRSHRDAATARDALRRRGIPAVVHGGAGVMETPAAHEWLELLRAMSQPWSTARLHRVAHGPFVGWDAQQLANAKEEEWDELDERVHSWNASFRTRGIAGLFRHVDVSGA